MSMKELETNTIITVDVARGVGNDYSAFVVVDITTFPHKVVAKYRDNTIKPMLFPSIIYQVHCTELQQCIHSL